MSKFAPIFSSLPGDLVLEDSPYSVFDAGCQTITNTVNCQGVMGAGLALEFKLRYPEVFEDYAQRAKAKAIKPGEPYVYRGANGLQVLNFPTKNAWRLPSRMEWITSGLDAIAAHWQEWGIQSLAVPRLGSSHGGLDWPRVKVEVIERLSPLPIRVAICLDEQPHPDGVEARILDLVNASDEVALARAGLSRSAVAALVEHRPFRRVRNLIEVKGVGKASYERLFQALSALGASEQRQAKLPLG
jgi:O-acetyl-ADP-ribose deacetylase (regulator of RNase III)